MAEHVYCEYDSLRDLIVNNPEAEEVQELHIKISIFNPLGSWWAQDAA